MRIHFDIVHAVRGIAEGFLIACLICLLVAVGLAIVLIPLERPASVLAQEKPAAKPAATMPAPPPDLTPEMKVSLATAQRDYMIAKTNFDSQLKRMQDLTVEAQQACDKLGKQLNADSISCVAATPAPKAGPAPTNAPKK